MQRLKIDAHTCIYINLYLDKPLFAHAYLITIRSLCWEKVLHKSLNKTVVKHCFIYLSVCQGDRSCIKEKQLLLH